MYLAHTFFLYKEHTFIYDFALLLEGQYNYIQIRRKLTDQLTTSLAKDEEENKDPNCDKHLPSPHSKCPQACKPGHWST